ncbi:MAG: hypothetical protein II688_06855, partial [Lachnospiraceae bacterium]|nr:hypothetical protein [Lachnospiraceae bacterium]
MMVVDHTRTYRTIFFIFLISALVFCFSKKADAKDLDEILDYEITIDVRDDARLNINYHIRWKVLDSVSEGPLSWVKIGVPNYHAEDLKALTSNIKTIRYSSDGGCFAKITFDRSYRQGEIVDFSFELVQDYMYQVDKLKSGETVYEFAPGWFDDIKVDSLVIRWKNDKVLSFSPSCYNEDGYLVWRSALKKGEKYSVSVTYNNNAYGFDLSKKI